MIQDSCFLFEEKFLCFESDGTATPVQAKRSKRNVVFSHHFDHICSFLQVNESSLLLLWQLFASGF